jgi:hypothetical protein
LALPVRNIDGEGQKEEGSLPVQNVEAPADPAEAE